MKRTLRDRIIHAFFLSKFEPMETVLALSSILHGLWLMFPEWRFTLEAGTPIGEGSRYGEMGLGFLMFLFGAIHIFTIIIDSRKRRKGVLLTEFMLWFFITWLAITATSATSIIWIAYLTIALFAGLIYLNVSFGGRG